MTYVEGFVVPVPTANKEAYLEHAAATVAPMFKEFGATRIVECWGDDVPARQGHRLLPRGAGEGRRDGRLFSGSNIPTRRPATPPTRR